ncbi:MAG: hypothetical protein IIZ15_03200, partial [Coriobacteriales bacterium]|nr:hypothetical protein [Coriobacteriales bacterium]
MPYLRHDRAGIATDATMNEDSYNRMLTVLRARPQVTRVLLAANRLLTAAGYLLYPLLLILLAVQARDLLLRGILVPAVSFALLSMFRRALNAPRPYEVYGIEPLIHKETRGKTFPSRHTFCMFLISSSWLLLQAGIWVGGLL